MSPEEIDRYRAYLMVLARQQVLALPEAKLDTSGVVQQTLLDAHQAADVFAGLTSEQRLAWLRTALTRNLTDVYRRLFADKRDVRREEAIAVNVENSARGLDRWLAVNALSPSQETDRNELLLRVALALSELPDAQRIAIEGHYFERRPVSVIATEMGRTAAAVAGLLKRGLQTLRQHLADAED